jgi:hypothetical protein
VSAESVEARDVQLGKDGSKWRHNYVPVNAVAAAMKAHRWKGHGGSAPHVSVPKGKKDRSAVVEIPHSTRGKAAPSAAVRKARQEQAKRAIAAMPHASSFGPNGASNLFVGKRDEHIARAKKMTHAELLGEQNRRPGRDGAPYRAEINRRARRRASESAAARDGGSGLAGQQSAGHRTSRPLSGKEGRETPKVQKEKVKPDTPARAKAREEIAARDARTIDTAKLRGGALAKHGIKEGMPAKFHIPAETKFEPHPYHAHSGSFPMHGQPERTLDLQGSTNMANVAFTHDTNTGKVLGLNPADRARHYLHPDTKKQIEKAADSSGNPHFHRDANGNVIYSHWQEPTGTTHTVREAEDRTGHVWHVGSTSIIVASKHPKTGAAEFHTLNYRPSRGFDQARRHDSGKDKAAVEENMRRHAQSIAETMRRQQDYDQKHGRDRRSIAERLRAADAVSESRLAARKKKAS